MSKGPGRVERAISALFDAEPDSAFTTEELCERIYPGAAIEKKHRVAVIRAAKNLMVRRPEVIWLRGRGLGKTLILCRRDNFASFALGFIKSDEGQRGRALSKDPRYHWLTNWRTPAQNKAKVREKGAALMRDRSDRQVWWYRRVRLFLAERDGDTQTVTQLKADEERGLEAFRAAMRAMAEGRHRGRRHLPVM